MPTRISTLLLIISTASGVVAARQDPATRTKLTIALEDNHYVLTVPVSRLVMRLPRGAWMQAKNDVGGATASPTYFYFENKTSGQFSIASGWFAPDSAFKSIETFWTGEMAAFKRSGAPTPQNISFEDIGSWKAIVYAIEQSGIGSAHIRAHWIQAGTWIDLHLSLTSYDAAAESWRKLRDILKGIQVLEKK